MNVIDILLNEYCCIYAFINEEDKKVLFGHSRNMSNSILNLHNQFLYNKEIQKDRNKIELKTIETYTYINFLYPKARVDQLYREYKQLGYTFYNSYKPLGWKIEVQLGTSTLEGSKTYYRAIVAVKTHSSKSYPVKTFVMLKDAEKYASTLTLVEACRLAIAIGRE